MTRPRIADQVVVLTGASSGIGRETALALARRGARLVLAARGMAALDATVRDVEREGGHAIAVGTDVSDASQVDRLANAAIERYGRIDTWINDAAVATYATVEDLTTEEIDRVIDVDLLGAIYGTRAALAQMKARGQGTIINVSSGLAMRSLPLMSTYCAAKAGLNAFTESLRVELARDHPGISVSVILPSSIDTPFYDHARSKLGRAAKPYAPVYAPEAVARAIVFAAQHPRRAIYVGVAGRLLAAAEQLSPALVDRYMLQGDRAFGHMLSNRPAPRDNLFEPVDEPPASHGSHPPHFRRSLYTQLAMRRGLTLALASLGALGIVGLWQWRRAR